ncbi:hypothetical protein LIER_26099 [Lithospermum erythrorhizon]|uniref:Uncharacterized protein n=1 Tax=Lithospermum erythrorhizon TaxID=34254 RepID=A0AAV3R7F9_LITER
MDWSHKFLFIIVLIGFDATQTTHGYAVVSGSVFCDQCKDGLVSLFDYPLYGIKVAMACPGSDGQLQVMAEETTNPFGQFSMRFDGLPDLGRCYARVSGQGSSDCGAVAGPANALRVLFRMFDTAIYMVDPLVSQPAQPASYCSNSSTPPPGPVVPVTPSPPPPATNFPPPGPVVPVTPSPSPPATNLPPPGTMVPVTPSPPPPATSIPPPTPVSSFTEASACPHQSWIRPEYRCYWRVLTPGSKVAVVFGLIAARRYGTDMSLWEAMQARGDPYRTLLREGTTALLNSYNNLQFPYRPLSIMENMNYALMGSTKQVLHTGSSFRRANSGNGKVPCKLSVCN